MRSVLTAAAGALLLATAVTGKVYTLDEAVRLTLENNIEILDARNEVRLKKAAVWSDRSERLPEVAVDGTYANGETSGESYTTSLRASQELFRIGKMSPSTVAAHEALISAETAYEQTKLDRVYGVRKAFIDYLLVREELALRTDLAVEFEKRHQRMQGRLAAGKVKPIDVKEAELAFLDEELRVNGLKRRRRAAKLALMDLMGVMGNELPDDAEFDGDISALTGVPEADGLERYLALGTELRLDLKELAAYRDIQAKQVLRTWFQWLPDVGASGAGAYYKSGTGILELDLKQGTDLWRTVFSARQPLRERGMQEITETEEWGVSLDFSLPLFKGFDKFAKLNMAKAELVALDYDIAAARNAVLLDVSNAFFAMNNLEEREALEARRVETTKERMFIVEELIELPMDTYITYDDVLRRREDFTRAQEDYFSLRRSYLFAVEDFKLTVGMKPWDKE